MKTRLVVSTGILLIAAAGCRRESKFEVRTPVAVAAVRGEQDGHVKAPEVSQGLSSYAAAAKNQNAEQAMNRAKVVEGKARQAIQNTSGALTATMD